MNMWSKCRYLAISCRRVQHFQRATYKSAVCTDFSKPLEIIDDGKTFDPSSLGQNEVSVAVKACGVNFSDIMQCKGTYQVVNHPPFVPGVEFAGEVLAVGDKVKRLKKKDRVFGLVKSGSFCQHCVMPEHTVLRTFPDSVSYEVAAASIVSYGTSLMALTRKARLQEGETLFVTGAAGSTGLAAVEIGSKLLKAKVIGSCGGQNKADIVKSKGASHVIDYNTEDVRGRLKELTNGKGPDVVFDTVGGDLFLECLKSLAHEGRILTIGYTSGKIPNIPANYLLIKSVSAIGLYWGDYGTKNSPVFSESIDRCVDGLVSGDFSPHVGAVLPLSEINKAFDMISKRQNIGKVVVTMD
ncbi:quinone oxidoreductase-like protein 2 homolog isoform X2 [Mizuhopecten yessoensis]|uniref:Quinone oxidoreductase-like protein 2 n=1 Tax=Mizuhopecten yessoensis TaxID=6573 RepID=A0A210R6R4_MIZYE|nr:quinone oxidoreductase-like protein 2 homolog isoform X1 [Mizuhopecten yessoensis]XP_021369391.1 quinone oxidoreductase-like protein 2 homolog isoform X2 [Mizuhopecten yessoensis]OWF56747.1 Quinone oxidoreductase-like protein 2 [Mizuhopecten yessoensis]